MAVPRSAMSSGILHWQKISLRTLSSNVNSRFNGFAKIAAMFTKAQKRRKLARPAHIHVATTNWNLPTIKWIITSWDSNANNGNYRVMKGESYD